MKKEQTFNDLKQKIKDLEKETDSLKQELEALKKSGELARSFMNSATDGLILLDKEMNVVEINEAAMSMFGVDRSVIGVNAVSVAPDVKNSGRYEQYLSVMRGGEPVFIDDISFQSRLGRLHLAVKAFKVGDCLGMIITNITERKNIEKELLTSGAQLMLRNRIAKILLTSEGEQMYADVLFLILEELKSRFGYFGYINENGDLQCPSLTYDIWDQCSVPGKRVIFPKENWGGLWGRSLLEKKLLYANQSLNTPEGHVPIKRALVCPIIHKGELVGQIAIADKSSDYAQEDFDKIQDITVFMAPFFHARLERNREERKRRQAEDALRESEERYRTLIARMVNGFALHEIICDENGKPCDYRFLEVNKAFERLTGKSAEELIGNTVLEVLPGTEPYWIEVYGKVALTGESIHLERYSKEFDKYYEVLAYRPTKGQFAVVFTDVTERRKNEDALKFTQFAIDHYSDGAFWMGPDARFIYVNDAACRSLGYSRSELLTMTVHDIDPDFPKEVWPDHWEELKTKGSFIVTSHHKAKDGLIFPVELIVNYVKFGEEEYNCAFARDISNRIKEDEEREKLRENLMQARKMEAIAALAGGVAHQFNNALALIVGNLDMMEMDSAGDESIIRYIQQMRDASQRMTKLTSQLLAYARGGKYQETTISPSDMVRDALTLIRHSVHPSINIDTDLPRNIQPVKADVTQMQMVLSAILQNSSEAIEGDGRIRISAANVNIDEASADNFPDLSPGHYSCLDIEDDGKGMDEDTKSKIFEPFFTTKFQGRGLGMAAVYGIIKNHGGSVFIASELNKGTAVRIFLPSVEDIAEKRKKPPTAPAPVKGSGTILVIEDEEMIMDVIRGILERLGYRVLEAETGKKAVEIVNSFDGDIELAILDIVLPDMKGNAVYPLIMKARPNLKVIVCSGYSINGPAREILDNGAQGFLQKPFNMTILSEKLKEVLNS